MEAGDGGQGGGHDPPGSEPRRLRGPWWFAERRELSPEQRRSLLSQLYFDGPERRPFLRRFTALLAASILIAAFGLASDSAPVVIGAMLVSPLTTPLLGLAAGFVMGWPRRQAESLLILAAGTVGGIALAWITMELIPEPTVLTLQSSELLARTEPRLLDLAVALVAGGAGAYVLVRREAVGALPGVAIAVALVPPLATVGMMLDLGEPELAADAFLLYITNLAGIVLAAAVVMLVTGARPRDATHDGRSPRLGIALALLAVVVVTVPLAAVTAERTRDAVDHDDAAAVVSDWLAGTGMEVLETRVEEGRVHVELAGPDRPPPVEALAAQLADELDQEVQVTADWIEAERYEAGASP